MLASERWCYLMARVLLQQGRNDRALMFIGELMQTHTGHRHAQRLLAEFAGTAAAPSTDDLGFPPASAWASGIHRKARTNADL